MERWRARASGNEATEVRVGGNGEKADGLGLVGQSKESDFTHSEVGSSLGFGTEECRDRVMFQEDHSFRRHAEGQ